ncbi:MAG: hypothetical protein HYX40_07160 [Sphingobacteriales bacterium]|nr:hypothetical protein [Sphingobacteriales bacterium]
MPVFCISLRRGLNFFSPVFSDFNILDSNSFGFFTSIGTPSWARALKYDPDRVISSELTIMFRMVMGMPEKSSLITEFQQKYFKNTGIFIQLSTLHLQKG